MTDFPLTVEVVRVRPGPDVLDPYDTPVPGPEVEDTVMVFAAWIGSSQEPDLPGHVMRVESDGGIIAKPGDFQPSDKVRVGDSLLTVEGRPEDYNANPWWSPGLVLVNLKEATG